MVLFLRLPKAEEVVSRSIQSGILSKAADLALESVLLLLWLVAVAVVNSLGCFRMEGVTASNFSEAGGADVASFVSAKSPLAGGHFAKLIRACAAPASWADTCSEHTVAFQRRILAYIACGVHVIMPDLIAIAVGTLYVVACSAVQMTKCNQL